MHLNQLRRMRDKQLGAMKERQRSKRDNDQQFSQEPVQGLSKTTQEQKKRKRPDDKKQNISKKIGSQARSTVARQSKSSVDFAEDQQTKAQLFQEEMYRVDDFEEEIDVEIAAEDIN